MLDFVGSLLNTGLKLFGMEKDREASSNNARIQQEQFERQMAAQKEFAQNAIQWRAADAKAAGLHPLAALGASSQSYSPIAVGATTQPSMAQTLGDMGQDITRAAGALVPKAKRDTAAVEVAQAQEVTANNLKLENMKLQNDILRSKLATVNQPGTPPGVPFPVPENKKPEERPPLMFGGRRWDTSPDTSPMKAWEDQYGDEGPVSWLLPPVMAMRDLAYNVGFNPENWRSGLLNTHADMYMKWLRGRQQFGEAWDRMRKHPVPVRRSYDFTKKLERR